MDQAKLSALLGRPLTPIEVTNMALYLERSKESLEQLLCISLDVHGESPTATARTYRSREGYSTVFADIFTGVPSVTINGAATTLQHPAFWDNRNLGYYNSLVFDNQFSCEQDVVITALWGFASLPDDLAQLWAQSFALVATPRAIKRVKSKKNEDFSIAFADITDDQSFLDDNRRVIGKYRMCDTGYIRHGKVRGRHGHRI